MYAQMSIQCDDCAIRVKYLLLVARNYILLLFIFLGCGTYRLVGRLLSGR
jgi:hypothetical protein